MSICLEVIYTLEYSEMLKKIVIVQPLSFKTRIKKSRHITDHLG